MTRSNTGKVFLNEKSLYEKETPEQVMVPEFRDTSGDRDFTKHIL